MMQRWYDKDPTLSMAISLLQNATAIHQEMAARYLFKVMESEGVLHSQALATQEDRVRFMFPAFRRNRFELHARHLIETLKHLGVEDQQRLAVQLINYIYILDCGMSDFPLPDVDVAEQLLQPESG